MSKTILGIFLLACPLLLIGQIEITSCPDISVNTSPFSCSISVNYDVGYTTNCAVGDVVISSPYPSGTDFPLGMTTFTITLTDDCSNVATCEASVEVVDNIEPIAVCNDDLEVNISGDAPVALTATDVNQGSADNCGPVAVSISRQNPTPDDTPDMVYFSCTDVGTEVTITLTVTDTAGLTNTCWFSLIPTNTSNSCAPASFCNENTGVCSNDLQGLIDQAADNDIIVIAGAEPIGDITIDGGKSLGIKLPDIDCGEEGCGLWGVVNVLGNSSLTISSKIPQGQMTGLVIMEGLRVVDSEVNFGPGNYRVELGESSAPGGVKAILGGSGTLNFYNDGDIHVFGDIEIFGNGGIYVENDEVLTVSGKVSKQCCDTIGETFEMGGSGQVDISGGLDLLSGEMTLTGALIVRGGNADRNSRIKVGDIMTNDRASLIITNTGGLSVYGDLDLSGGGNVRLFSELSVMRGNILGAASGSDIGLGPEGAMETVTYQAELPDTSVLNIRYLDDGAGGREATLRLRGGIVSAERFGLGPEGAMETVTYQAELPDTSVLNIRYLDDGAGGLTTALTVSGGILNAERLGLGPEGALETVTYQAELPDTSVLNIQYLDDGAGGREARLRLSGGIVSAERFGLGPEGALETVTYQAELPDTSVLNLRYLDEGAGGLATAFTVNGGIMSAERLGLGPEGALETVTYQAELPDTSVLNIRYLGDGAGGPAAEFILSNGTLSAQTLDLGSDGALSTVTFQSEIEDTFNLDFLYLDENTGELMTALTVLGGEMRIGTLNMDGSFKAAPGADIYIDNMIVADGAATRVIGRVELEEARVEGGRLDVGTPGGIAEVNVSGKIAGLADIVADGLVNIEEGSTLTVHEVDHEKLSVDVFGDMLVTGNIQNGGPEWNTGLGLHGAVMTITFQSCIQPDLSCYIYLSQIDEDILEASPYLPIQRMTYDDQAGKTMQLSFPGSPVELFGAATNSLTGVAPALIAPDYVDHTWRINFFDEVRNPYALEYGLILSFPATMQTGDAVMEVPVVATQNGGEVAYTLGVPYPGEVIIDNTLVADPAYNSVSFNSEDAGGDIAIFGCGTCDNGRVQICRAPRNKPNLGRTLCVKKESLIFNLNTGAYCGPCQTSNGPPQTTFRNAYPGLLVYPNPAKDGITIALPEQAGGPRLLRLVDLSGRTLRQETVDAGEVTAWMSVAGLAKGMYVLQVQGDLGTDRVKVMVE